MKFVSILRLLPKVVVISALLFELGAMGLHAEVRTLTDKQGRSLKAEVLSIDGDSVFIRREDGQTFSLSLSSLSDDDQRSLKDWAAREAAKPAALPSGAIKVQLSRGIFKTDKHKIDVKLTTGEKVKDGMTITEDKWGYDVTLSNTTSNPISKLRAEYILFSTVDDIHTKGKQGLKQKAFKTSVPSVPALDHINFHTETITATKEKYNGNIVAAGSGASSSRETLYGIWIRLYQDDQLVYETAFPQGLSTTEKWE